MSTTEPAHEIAFFDGDRRVVTIDLKDGSVTFGEGISPDEAARTFWQAITPAAPLCRCMPSPAEIWRGPMTPPRALLSAIAMQLSAARD